MRWLRQLAVGRRTGLRRVTDASASHATVRSGAGPGFSGANAQPHDRRNQAKEGGTGGHLSITARSPRAPMVGCDIQKNSRNRRR
jgi:hypothetical protein